MRTAWRLYTVVGVAAWIGITIYVGAVKGTEDPAPVRTAFVVGGALFSAGLLVFHLGLQRTAGKRGDDALYHKLALAYASLQVRAGVPIPDLAEQLGHSPAMTLSTYSHVMRDLKGETPMSAEEQILEARGRAVDVANAEEAAR